MGKHDYGNKFLRMAAVVIVAVILAAAALF